jgi:hypothetical protein
MEPMEQVKILQTMYAGALADAVLRLGQEGVLERVRNRKREEQLLGGKLRATQLGIASEEDVFLKLSALMGCADWSVERGESGDITARATRCMLCAFAKRMGAPSPCQIYCLDPMEGMVRGLNEAAQFVVQETLYEGACCRVEITQ